MRNRFSLALILILCLTAFSPLLFSQQSKTSLSIDQAKAKIKQMNEKWAQYLKAGNFQGIADIYMEDAVILPPNAKMARGRDAIKKHMEDENKDVRKFTNVDFNTVDVIGGNDLFVEIGKYKLSMQMKNSDKPFDDEGKYVTVWKVMPDGSMKVAVDTDNTDKSMKEMQSAMMPNEKTNDEMTGAKEKK